MAAENEQKISLKLFVDKEKNRVVFAESDKDFVDILFSFLTMPLGTIVRLLGKQSQPVDIGSLTSLYKGVADFESKHLRTETCKTTLLHPINSAASRCRKLKLNIDDTEPTWYFICSGWSCSRSSVRKFCSTQKDVRCICGNLMNTEVNLEYLTINVGAGWDGVFVHAEENFIITDDLRVMPTSTGSICALLKNLGISNMNVLDRRIVNVGLQEVSFILKLSLVSRSPMTDMFLIREQGFPPSNFEINIHLQNGSEASSSCEKMSVKLILRKSDNMILYAEAGEDFVDFLFSFLTLPLGSVVELLSGNSSLGCIDNLYRSVGDMNVGRYIGSEDIKSMLLHPKLSPQISFKNQPLGVKAAQQVTFIDPKWPSESRTSPGGYVKGPTMFMVTDNLLVKPLSTTSCIYILHKLNVPITDLEERVIHVGKEEALCLLKASLIAKNALNVGLNSMLKKVKQEV